MWRSFYHLNPKINTVVVRIPLRNDDDDSSEKLRSKPLSIVELEKTHGNGEFTRASGCELDLSDKPVGLGIRSRRYALLAEDGVVKVLNLEEGGAFTFSGAEDILELL